MQREGLVVLVVEDDPTTRDLLQTLLEAEGYAVECAANGAAGLARIEAGGVALLLLDLMLPAVNGLEVCQQVRARQCAVYLPTVMLTALHVPEQRHAGFAAGTDDYVSKPFHVDELVDRVQVWTQTRQRLLAAHEQQQRLEVERAERARLEGVLLAARTLADRVNNKHSLTVGWTELVAQDPALPPQLLDRVMEAQRGAREAAQVVARMLGVTHIHEREWHGYIGSTIDLDRSTS